MRLLLDTNVVLWLLLGRRARIPDPVVQILSDVDCRILVSAASVWEIAIKRSLGKLTIEDAWLQALQELDFEPLPIRAEHAAAVESLTWLHRDPFDRLLIAQAQVEGATLVTADSRIREYEIPTLWGSTNDDALSDARDIAHAEGRSIGAVISDLERKTRHPVGTRTDRGLPAFDVSPDTPTFGAEDVRRALDES